VTRSGCSTGAGASSSGWTGRPRPRPRWLGLDLIDRSRGLPGSVSNRTQSYRQTLFRLRLGVEGATAALAEFRTRVGERFGQRDTNTYQLWWLDNDFSSEGRILTNLLWKHGLYAEYVAFARESGSSANAANLQLARAWTGERDAVLRELTETLLGTDPRAPVVQGRGHFIEAHDYDASQPKLWARLAFEAGEVDARRAALDGAVERVRSDVDEALARLRGDTAAVAAAIEARGGTSADLLQAWTAAGRHEDVYQALAKDRTGTPMAKELECEPFDVHVEPLAFAFGEVQNTNSAFAGRIVSFPAMSFSSSRSSHQTVTSGSDGVPWIAACLRTGRAEEARVAVEAELLRRRHLSQARPGTSLANELLRLGLVDEARALFRRYMGEEFQDPSDAEGKLRSFERSALVRTARNGEDISALVQVVVELPLPEKPSSAAYDHWWRASALERAGADAALVQDQVDAARALDPEGRQEPKGARRAWISLALGDAAGAEALFRVQVAEAWARGRSITESRYGLGLALAAQDEPEAREVLRHAIASSPTYERAARARLALGL
jgi:hypothetical protein